MIFDFSVMGNYNLSNNSRNPAHDTYNMTERVILIQALHFDIICL